MPRAQRRGFHRRRPQSLSAGARPHRADGSFRHRGHRCSAPALAQMTALRILRLASTKTGDQTVSALARLKSLRSLTVTERGRQNPRWRRCRRRRGDPRRRQWTDPPVHTCATANRCACGTRRPACSTGASWPCVRVLAQRGPGLHARASVVGLSILALLLFRLGWGLMGSTTARFSDFLHPPRKVLQPISRPRRGAATRCMPDTIRPAA